MASVTKPKKSRYWYACFTSRDGKQVKKSTKLTDKRAALRVANELEDVENKARSQSLTKTQLQKVFSDVSEKVTGERMDIPTIEAYFESWLEAVERRNTRSTYQRYELSGRLFLKSLGQFIKQPITAVTPRHVEAFMESRLDEGMAPKTVAVDMKSINTAFRRALKYGIILHNPVVAVELPKVESSEKKPFTKEEIEKLMSAAESVEWQTMILLGAFLGARISDCARMRWENIDAETGFVRYTQQKTKKKMETPMRAELIAHLHYRMQFGCEGYLCPSLANLGTRGRNGLSEQFMRIVDKAGIDPEKVPGKGRRQIRKKTFHSLRHTLTSWLANAGVSKEMRMKILGHTTEGSHDQYTHMELDALKRAIDSV